MDRRRWRARSLVAAVAAAVIACAPLLAPAVARAQVPQSGADLSDEGIELGRELARLTEARRQLVMLMPSLAYSVRQMVTAANPLVAKDFDEVLPSVIRKVLRRPGSFEDIVARVYATHFSVAELKELVAFYNSAVGRKLVEKQPNLAQDVAKGAQPLSNELTRELADLMRKELRKRGHSL